jgi:hypothetical protein
MGGKRQRPRPCDRLGQAASRGKHRPGQFDRRVVRRDRSGQQGKRAVGREVPREVGRLEVSGAGGRWRGR